MPRLRHRLAVTRRGEVRLVFWQARYYDHNCRTPETVKEKIVYCHKNPVTEGWLPTQVIGDGRVTTGMRVGAMCRWRWTRSTPESIPTASGWGTQHGPPGPDNSCRERRAPDLLLLAGQLETQMDLNIEGRSRAIARLCDIVAQRII